MAYTGLYITDAVASSRLSAAVVRRIYDDNNDGLPDSDPVAQLIRDAEAMFEGYCRGIYDLAALRIAHPNEAIRLVLDCVEFLAAKRFPQACKRDWTILEASVRKELESLRKGLTRLDVMGSPEPAANQGGEVFNGTTADPIDVFEPTFLNGWGSY